MMKLLYLNQALDPEPRSQQVMIGMDAVRFLTPSMPEQKGKTIVGLLGTEASQATVAVMEEVATINEALITENLNLARVKYHDLAARPDFDNRQYIVAEQNIRLVKPVNDHFTIVFIDGTELNIKNLGGLAGANA